MTCKNEGCDRIARCRGWCDRCYRRWRKHGDATVVAKPGRKRRNICGTDGCHRVIAARGLCRPHLEELRAAERAARELPPITCVFCEALRVLTDQGHDHAEAARLMRKTPEWLDTHLTTCTRGEQP